MKRQEGEMNERTPYDSQPFYCTWCGGEYDPSDCPSSRGLQCCELESDAEAEERAWLHAAEAQPKYWDISGDMPVLRPIDELPRRLTAPEFKDAAE